MTKDERRIKGAKGVVLVSEVAVETKIVTVAEVKDAYRPQSWAA
jgi:hypothetical protein